MNLAPPPRRDDPRFDDWVTKLYQLLTQPATTQASSSLTPTQATDLTDGGDSTLHYHAEDRKRSNHTGTQTSQTISDFEARVRALAPSSDHAQLFSLAWTQSGHTGTATTVAGFNGSGVTEYLTRTGTGTVVVMQAAPTINGATIAGNLAFSGTARRITGDMSETSPFANRVAFQTSVTNGGTLPFVIPNGTNRGSGIIFSNSSDPDNGGYMAFICNNTAVGFQASKLGTGASVPMTFATGDSATERMRINTTGEVGIGMTASRTLDVTGTFGATGAATFGSTVSATQYTSTIATGTAPLVVTSTTKVSNLNVDQLDGGDWASPGAAIGTGTPVAGTFTSVADSKGDVRTIPQNSQSAAYTLVLADAGKHILHPSADTTARVFTIPANSSVAFPVGTAVTFVNQASAGTLTLAITTDTMRLAGAGTTGSRTLTANGIATALKITTTEWIISGTNLT
jgi:hypothetical protein